ncbi:hypothetical protein TSTA_045460, partial [Talaromyces stipitatus ATCC 10500]
FLASVRIEDSPQCECGLGDQDTAHVLIRCPTHINLRMETLWKEARETDYRKLLSEPQWVRQSIEFMMRTGLLTQFHHSNHVDSAWTDQPLDTFGNRTGHQNINITSPRTEILHSFCIYTHFLCWFGVLFARYLLLVVFGSGYGYVSRLSRGVD